MKKQSTISIHFTIIALLMALMSFGQYTPSNSLNFVKLLKTPPIGTKSDSILVWNGTDKFVHIIPSSELVVPTTLTTAGTSGASTLSAGNLNIPRYDTYADDKVQQTITNGVTTSAPSQDAVFDALALKADANDVFKLSNTGVATQAYSGLNANSISGTSMFYLSGSSSISVPVQQGFLHTGIYATGGFQWYHRFQNEDEFYYRNKTGGMWSANWYRIASREWSGLNLVGLTGNQTIAGVKTFSSSPIAPDATASTHLATLGQVQSGFIPITGTTVDNPVTGDLEFDSQDGLGLICDNTLSSNTVSKIAFNTLGVSIETIDQTTFQGTTLSLNKNQLFLTGGDLSIETDGKGIVGNTLFDKQNDPLAYAQMGDIATGFESAYTTTTQSITANTDTLISFAGATMESNGDLALIDEANNAITPLIAGDIISVDVAMPFTTPSGADHYCTLLLKVKTTGDIYRAVTHPYLKGSGNQDYITASWTIPVNATAVANGFELVINSDTGITIDRKYISTSRVHKAK